MAPMASPARARPNGYPGLAGDTMVMSHDATSVLRIILTGGDAPPAAGRPPLHAMPGFGKLDDGQVADVATYIRNAWGNGAPPVSATDVHMPAPGAGDAGSG